MSTTTSTATDAPLPALTTTEATAAVASIKSEGEYCVLQIAAQLKLAPHELLDILARPHVVAFAEAAREFVQMRTDILARDTYVTSLQSLAEVAQNRDNDVSTRLRAAIAILHGVREGPTPSSSRPRQLSANGGASPPRLYLPAPKPSAPSATPAVPEGRKPDRPANNEPDPIPTSTPRPDRSTPPADPITLPRAAGAPLARHDHHVSARPDCDIEHRPAHRAASTATSGRPP